MSTKTARTNYACVLSVRTVHVFSKCVCTKYVSTKRLCVYQVCVWTKHARVHVYLEVDPAEASLLHCEVLGDLEEARSVALLLDGGSLVPILPRVAFSPGTRGRERERERMGSEKKGAKERTKGGVKWKERKNEWRKEGLKRDIHNCSAG